MQEAHCTSLGDTPGNPTRSEPLPVEPGKKDGDERITKAINKSYKVENSGCDICEHICIDIGACSDVQ